MHEAERLAGLTILVTRPLHQAGHFCRLIEAAGGQVLSFPVIEIAEVVDPERLEQQLSTLGRVDYLVFISPNAVAKGLPKLRPYLLQTTQIAAIGKKTAQAIEAQGLQVRIVPHRGANSEALLEHPELQTLSGKQVVIVRGGPGRDLLEATLRERGAEVTLLDVYRRTIPQHEDALLPLLMQTDMIAITSNEGLYNLFAMSDDVARERLLHMPLLAGSRRVLELASELGFTATHIKAESPADDAMLEALLMWVESGEHRSV